MLPPPSLPGVPPRVAPPSSAPRTSSSSPPRPPSCTGTPTSRSWRFASPTAAPWPRTYARSSTPQARPRGRPDARARHCRPTRPPHHSRDGPVSRELQEGNRTPHQTTASLRRMRCTTQRRAHGPPHASPDTRTRTHALPRWYSQQTPCRPTPSLPGGLAAFFFHDDRERFVLPPGEVRVRFLPLLRFLPNGRAETSLGPVHTELGLREIPACQTIRLGRNVLSALPPCPTAFPVHGHTRWEVLALRCLATLDLATFRANLVGPGWSCCSQENTSGRPRQCFHRGNTSGRSRQCPSRGSTSGRPRQ